MNRPTNTIGITCYNAELTISFALDSALDQTYNAHEITLSMIPRKTTLLALLTNTPQRQNIFVFKNKFNSGMYSRNLIIENATANFSFL